MRTPVLVALPVLLFSMPLFAQQAPTPTASDPQAVAVVQAAIKALGGATAIGALQSWTLRAQAKGRIANGAISEVLVAAIPQSSGLPAGTTAKAPPPWARPRSLFVPALVSAILLKESQDPNFSLNQETSSPLPPNSAVVVFSVTTKAGTSVPAQRWYFDKTTNLPTRIGFILPAKVGLMEAFPGTVMFSDYRAVGGVLYPFQIVTFLQRQNATQTITLQSITPSTTVPTASITTPGGAL